MIRFHGSVHVFGGTSDAVALCKQLQQWQIHYSVSVATEAGAEAAAHLHGDCLVGRIDSLQMVTLFQQRNITTVIDATHPFALEVSNNIIAATSQLQIPLLRYERPSLIDTLTHPLLYKVEDEQAACEVASTLGNKVFLTTGSKTLATYRQRLADKTLIVRVLPTVNVIQSCVDLGLTIDHIVAIKGPFSRQMNEAMYQFYQPDCIITKESGAEGGYQEKVLPCLALNIPCIVICRPKSQHQHPISTFEQLYTQLQRASHQQLKMQQLNKQQLETQRLEI